MPLEWPGASTTSVALDAGWLATTAAAPSLDRINARVSQAGFGLVHCTRIEPWLRTVAEVTVGRAGAPAPASAVPASGVEFKPASAVPASRPPSSVAMPLPPSTSTPSTCEGRGSHAEQARIDRRKSPVLIPQVGARARRRDLETAAVHRRRHRSVVSPPLRLYRRARVSQMAAPLRDTESANAAAAESQKVLKFFRSE